VRLQVYQVISTATATLDNCVEFYVRNQLPSLPGLPPAEPIVSTLRLRHSLEILPGSNVQITFEDTQVNVTGELSLHALPSTHSLEMHLASRSPGRLSCMLAQYASLQAGCPWLRRAGKPGGFHICMHRVALQQLACVLTHTYCMHMCKAVFEALDPRESAEDVALLLRLK